MSLPGFPGRDELRDTSAEVAIGKRDQPSCRELIRNQIVGHVAPPEPLEDHLFLHHLIAHGACAGTLEDEVTTRGRIGRAVADDTLHELAHPLEGCIGRRKRQEARGRDRNKRDPHQRHGFKPRVSMFHVMENQVNFLFGQQRPRSRERLELEVQMRLRVRSKKRAQ